MKLLLNSIQKLNWCLRKKEKFLIVNFNTLLFQIFTLLKLNTIIKFLSILNIKNKKYIIIFFSENIIQSLKIKHYLKNKKQIFLTYKQLYKLNHKFTYICLSTTKGILSGKVALTYKIGGKLLFTY